MESGSLIEVFQTNVEEKKAADALIQLFLQHFPGSRINFDLQDCDRILRVEGNNFCSNTIILLMEEKGFYSKILE